MELSTKLLSDWENLIAAGDTDEALTKLRAFKDQTAYKGEILTLSSRWESLSREQISGTLSGDEVSRRSNQLSKDLLRLVNAIRRELAGEPVNENLLPQKEKATAHFPLTVLLGSMLLTGLAVASIAYFAWHIPEKSCPTALNLNGAWEVFSNDERAEQSLGFMKIKQDVCENDFNLSGALQSVLDPGKEIDFTASIAGIHEGKISFYYENFDGEKGICTGVVPALNGKEFTVTCTDLIGYNLDDDEVNKMRFRKVEQ